MQMKFILSVLQFTHRARKWIITGSIARSAKRRYISYSEGDFEVFRRAWWNLAWRSGLRVKFHPHRCNSKGIGLKTEIFTEISPKFGI